MLIDSKEDNPFVIGKYAEDELFCDRVQETDFLRKQVQNGRNVSLISPRRLGKTDLIWHFFGQKDVLENYNVFFVDIYSTNSLNEFVYLLGKNVFSQLKSRNAQVIEQFFQIIKSLRPGFKLDAITGEPTFEMGLSYIEPHTSLDEIFEYLETAEKPCIVAIDEFQQIANYPEKNVEALLRTKIQQCRRTSFIFSGSRRHLMTQMFMSPSKPFYQSTITMNLEPIPFDKYQDFALTLFEKRGKKLEPELFEKVYKHYDGVTLFVQMLMNELYSLTAVGKTCSTDMFETARANVTLTQVPMYKEILNQLPLKQKVVLLAIAKEGRAEKITSGAFVKKYGLLSSSSVQAALKGLFERDLILETNGVYQVYDRLFSEWLKEFY